MKTAVLIVLTGSLGDVVRGLPLATLVKRDLPAFRLGWVVERTWRDLLAGHPALDRVLVFDRRRPTWSIWRLWRSLRAEGWDVSLDLQRILKSGLIALASGARRRIGFPRGEAKELSHLFQTESIAPAPARHKMDRYLDFARHLGIEISAPLDFGLGGVEPAWSLVGPPRPLVTLLLGSAWPAKDWPAFRAVELARLVTARSSADLVLVGDARRHEEAAAVARAVEAGRVVNLVGKTSLLDLAGVLSASSVAVGPDSGPGHLAAGLGTPYVGLFGPTDPARVAPYGCDALAVTAPRPCEGCPRRRCRRPQSETCMASIEAEAVFDRLRALLPALPHRCDAAEDSIRPHSSATASSSSARRTV